MPQTIKKPPETWFGAAMATGDSELRFGHAMDIAHDSSSKNAGRGWHNFWRD
jgi:hypothetical protein